MRRIGRIRQGRYIRLLMPEHPNSDAKGYVLEHRAVMSWLLGRPLRSNEVVHHINRVRDDNRWQNLAVMSPAEHTEEHRHQPLRPTCRRGHPWQPETTFITRSGARTCRLCKENTRRAWRANRKSKVA